jgi:hypothetical protein
VLDAILTPEYQNVVAAMADDDIESVALREVRLIDFDDQSSRHVLTSKNALASLHTSGLELAAYSVVYASFSIVPRVRKRRRCFRLSVSKGNKLKHDAPWTEATMQDIVSRLGLRRATTP